MSEALHGASTPLRCPRCAGALYELDTPEGVAVDFCQGCKGIFFDGGEVAVYFELASDLPEGEARLVAPRSGAPECPRGHGAMGTVHYRRDPSFVVERCGACGGMWLDQGEVPRMERLSTEFERPGARLALTLKRLTDAGYQLLGVR